MDFRKEKIRAEALRLGFSFIGFTNPRQTPHFSAYEDWLHEPQPEELGYLKKKYVLDARKEPRVILEGVRTVIVLGLAYPKSTLPIPTRFAKSKKFGRIAAYACLPDYHRWFKDRSGKLVSFMKTLYPSSDKMKLFVDSGPVMEKDFAFQAGLGWIGKNSLFISPFFGSFCLLGCLFVDLDLEQDFPDETDLCGKCDLCIRYCPTQAISDNRRIKASRCISFLTTNAMGDIPDQLCEKIGDHVFGCDICQSVCPLNLDKPILKIKQKEIPALIINNMVDLRKELEMNERSYLEKYSLTPIGKLPYEIFLRNLIIAVGNTGERSFIGPMKNMIKVHSSSIIHSTAHWAIESLK